MYQAQSWWKSIDDFFEFVWNSGNHTCEQLKTTSPHHRPSLKNMKDLHNFRHKDANDCFHCHCNKCSVVKLHKTCLIRVPCFWKTSNYYDNYYDNANNRWMREQTSGKTGTTTVCMAQTETKYMHMLECNLNCNYASPPLTCISYFSLQFTTWVNLVVKFAVLFHVVLKIDQTTT